MKAARVGLVMMLMAGVLDQATAGELKGFSIGPKIWYAKVKDFESGLLYGVSANANIGEEWWLSGYGCFGRITDNNFDYDLADAEFVFGRSEPLFDWGVGLRYMQFAAAYYEYNDNVDAYGPMIYIGTGQLFGDGPLGWYAGGSLGYASGDAIDGEFITYEGGLYANLSNWLINAGIRGWGDFDTLDILLGPAASVVYHF